MTPVQPEDLGLLTDLYGLTMAQSYFQQGMSAPATFSLFVRQYPPNRSYFVAAGLGDVLNYLENWHLPENCIGYLRSTEIFSEEFLDYLLHLRFTGEVWAIPEGRLFFVEEPILEVTGPIIETQLVETFIINQINLQSIIATKAARCVWAADGKTLVDFSLRRDHGIDAGMKVAKASYIAGFQSTSNVLAGKEYGIPISGTMAHSYVTSFENEIDAFRAFVQSFPERSIPLIDTYDTVGGARKAVQVAKEMEEQGQRLQGVRLDSGYLASLSREVRNVLDEEGLHYVNIFVSGGLDEFDVHHLNAIGSPIDGFGIGTKMGVSSDAPWSDMVYKLVKYNGRPVLKLSKGKATLPSDKQVFRVKDAAGFFYCDVICLRDEPWGNGKPLLEKVMDRGRIMQPIPSLHEVRARFSVDFQCLDEGLKVLWDPPLYAVSLSPRLEEMYRNIERDILGDEAPAVG